MRDTIINMFKKEKSILDDTRAKKTASAFYGRRLLRES